MADIRRKRATPRRAVAVGELQAGTAGFAAITERTLPKGDALAMAESLSQETRDAVMAEVVGLQRQTNLYAATQPVAVPAFLSR